MTTWFLVFYMIDQAKIAISSLELSRHLGVKYDTAWLLHNKILRAMAEREEDYLLRGKIPIVAAVTLNEAGHPIHARITAVSGFSSEAIADWAKRTLHLAAICSPMAWPASAP